MRSTIYSLQQEKNSPNSERHICGEKGADDSTSSSHNQSLRSFLPLSTPERVALKEIQVRYGNRSMLFTGDAAGEEFHCLFKNSMSLKSLKGLFPEVAKRIDQCVDKLKRIHYPE